MGDENGEDEDEGATSSMTKTKARDDGDDNGEDEDDVSDEDQYEDKGENGDEDEAQDEHEHAAEDEEKCYEDELAGNDRDEDSAGTWTSTGAELRTSPERKREEIGAGGS